MLRTIMASVALMAMSACGSPGAVGENSAGSIKTTAVGSVVDTIPSATPTASTNDTVTVNLADDAEAKSPDNMAAE